MTPATLPDARQIRFYGEQYMVRGYQKVRLNCQNEGG